MNGNQIGIKCLAKGTIILIITSGNYRDNGEGLQSSEMGFGVLV